MSNVEGHMPSPIEGDIPSQVEEHVLSQVEGHVLSRVEGHVLSQVEGRGMSHSEGTYAPSDEPSRVSESDTVTLLIEQAQAASRKNKDVEARRLLKAALRHDPNNAEALLWLVYLAEDGHASLSYLSRFLDRHPQHPHARRAIRWARRRNPTSTPSETSRVGRHLTAGLLRPRGAVVAAVALGAVLVVGLLWIAVQPPAAPVQARAGQDALFSLSPSPTARPLTELVPLLIPLFTPTPTPAPTAAASPTPSPLPSSVWVPVAGHPQTYNLSCESRSAADLAGFWGVAVDELEFLSIMGKSDNPHVGFVGDATMPPGSLPPYGYGVYSEPVAATMRDYGLDARPVYALGLDGVKAELLAGRPVLVWATYGMELNDPIEWTSVDGRVSTIVPFMHTFLVVGFDEEGVFLLDAFDATVQYYTFETFLPAWNLFDEMAVTVSGTLQ
jgi:uncharacterized protein YvpB